MHELLGRLNIVFKGFTGCRIDYVPAAKLNFQDWPLLDLEGVQIAPQDRAAYIKSVNGDRLGFVVLNEGVFSGLIVVSNWQASDARRLFDLADLATSMIERQISGRADELITQVDGLKKAEENLTLQRGFGNVIPLSRAKQPLIDESWSADTAASELVVSPLLLQVHAGFPIHRLALELHERSQRFAFLALNQMPKHELETSAQFAALGPVTLYIEDLSMLSLERQRELAKLLSVSQGDETPLVISAISNDKDLLIETGLLDQELAGLLVHTRLPWNPQDSDASTVRRSVRLIIEGEGAVPATTRFVPFHQSYHNDDNPTMH